MPKDDNGQRVTNALLRQDITQLSAKFDDFISETREYRKDMNGRTRVMEVWQGSMDTNYKNIKSDVEVLEQRSSGLQWWNGANTALSVVAGILGSMFGPRQ